jgi:tetratricopeptide (TPR) repeat protein
MRKLKPYFFLISVLFISIKSIASTNKTINQLPSKTPDHNHLLAVDNLQTIINHKLKTHFNALDLSIYLSGLPIHNFLKKAFFNEISTANYLEALAIYDARSNQLEDAISNFKKAYELSSRIDNKFQSFVIAYNLANMFFFRNDLANADLYSSCANKYIVGLSKPKLKFDQLIFESKIAASQNQTKKAENLILKNALPMVGRLGKKQEYSCYLQLGEIYLNAKRFTESKWFFIQALTTASKINFKQGEIESLILLSKTKVEIKDYDLALQDLQKAKAIIEEGYPIYQEDLNLNMAIVNKKVNK